MRNKTHIEFVEQWAEYVRNNPNWKKKHTEFINSQFQISENFIKKLIKEKNGKDKIIKVYKIKNVNGYKYLFKNIKNKFEK